MNHAKVLIVDDEWNMRNLLKIRLVKSGFSVMEAINGRDAIEKLSMDVFHLVILDVMMPELDGWDVCKEIRKQGLELPVLMLTARTDTADKVKGLGIGADDYLTKPFEPEELVARVHALLRRTFSQQDAAETSKHQIKLTDFLMDLNEYQVFVKEEAVHFTPKEFELLKFFLVHPNQVFTREQLLMKVWGIDYLGDDRTVDTHIRSIRKKVKKGGLGYSLIETVWGVGYKASI